MWSVLRHQHAVDDWWLEVMKAHGGGMVPWSITPGLNTLTLEILARTGRVW